jgi:hypothetical protein
MQMVNEKSLSERGFEEEDSSIWQVFSLVVGEN